MHEKLSTFIEHARQRGIDHATIFLLLQSHGWKDREIAEACAARELLIPVPVRTDAGSARDAFFHLLAFTALGISASAVIFLFFTYIDLAFPDPAERGTSSLYDFTLSGIRHGLALLIVAWPTFLLVWWFLLREIHRIPEKAKTGVRRWLAYLFLFAGVVTIMGDVIVVINYLVDGDLTVRFLLKVLVLFVIPGALSLYLALVLRSETEAVK